jgi:hypothetical protein
MLAIGMLLAARGPASPPPSSLPTAAFLRTTVVQPADHPFNGAWTADMSRSRWNGTVQVKESTLALDVTADSVTIVSRTVDVNDRVIGPTTTRFVTDGAPHRHNELMPGLMVVARWTTARLLDTVLTRANGIVDHVAYEVSEEGATLTTRTSGPLATQEIVFRRR